MDNTFNFLILSVRIGILLSTIAFFFWLFNNYELKDFSSLPLYKEDIYKGYKRRTCIIPLGNLYRYVIYYPHTKVFNMTKGCGEIQANIYIRRVRSRYGKDSLYALALINMVNGVNKIPKPKN